MRQIVKVISINLALCAAVLALLEIGLRVAETNGYSNVAAPGFPWLKYDFTNDMWRNRKSVGEYPFDIDAYGNRVIDVAQRPEIPPVACIGDSTVFGCWKDGQQIRFDNFPEQLAIALRSHVYNLGTVGHTTREGVIRMREVPAGVKVVIARYSWNDHARERTLSFPGSAILRQLLPARIDPGPLKCNVTESELRENVREIGRIAKERGQRLIWLDYPIRLTDHNDNLPLEMHKGLVRDRHELENLHTKYVSIIEETCMQSGIEFVKAAIDDRGFSPDDCVHPNDLGSAQMGRHLAQVIRDGIQQQKEP